jgi:hypothetical protein
MSVSPPSYFSYLSVSVCMCECLSICTLKCIPFRPFVCRFVWNSCVQADDVTSWRGLPPLADCRKHLHTWHIQQPIAIFFSSLPACASYLLLILEQTNTFIYTYTGPPFFLFGRKTRNKNRKNKSWEKRFFLLFFLLGGGNAQHIFRRFLFDISIEPDETSVWPFCLEIK